MSEKRCCLLLQGLFIGGLVGVALGILFAPRSGKETRREIGDKAADLSVRMKEECGTALEKGKCTFESLLKQLKKAEAEAEDKARTGAEWITRAFPVVKDLKGETD